LDFFYVKKKQSLYFFGLIFFVTMFIFHETILNFLLMLAFCFLLVLQAGKI